MKQKLYLFGLAAIAIGFLLGYFVNQYAGYALISGGAIWTIIFIIVKNHEPKEKE